MHLASRLHCVPDQLATFVNIRFDCYGSFIYYAFKICFSFPLNWGVLTHTTMSLPAELQASDYAFKIFVLIVLWFLYTGLLSLKLSLANLTYNNDYSHDYSVFAVCPR